MASEQAIVVHPETQHSYETALGLQQAGLLDRFVTGFYHKPGSLAGRALALLPGAVGQRLRGQATRRQQAGLEDARVQSHPLLALALRATDRSPRLRSLAPGAWRSVRDLFERRAAAAIRSRRPKGVIAYDTYALGALQAAREAGAHAILDQATGHLAFRQALMAEEAALHPDFADSLGYDQPPGNLEHCLAESAAADWILAPSDYVRGTLLERGVALERIVAMPYGVDTERFTPPAARGEGKFRVLYAGGISQHKGVKYLLEAMRRLGLKDAELVLVGGIVGSGGGLKPYAGAFTHLPFLPREALARQYQAADIYVFPSLHEGSSLSVFEALASGLPVVTTPNAGSVVRDGVEGFILPIRDVEGMADRILRLYRDRELRRAMGEQARARALDFTWEHYRRRLAAWFAALPPRAD
jgi:glycosyltransferase involved in cell wall biosynthesis